MYLGIHGALIIGLIVVFPAAAEKWWPNFSCHWSLSKESPAQEQSVSMNNVAWRNCVEKNQKYKEGNCPKICRLVRERVVYQKQKPDGPVIFDTDKFIEYFADELGYKMNKLEGEVKQLMDKVKTGINECRKNFPEYEGLKNLKTAACPPWDPFLKCLDGAIGC